MMYVLEETNMLLNPTHRYLQKKAKLEMAKNLLDEGFPIDMIIKVSGLSEKDILNAK